MARDWYAALSAVKKSKLPLSDWRSSNIELLKSQYAQIDISAHEMAPFILFLLSVCMYDFYRSLCRNMMLFLFIDDAIFRSESNDVVPVVFWVKADLQNYSLVSFRLFLSLNSDEGRARAPGADRGQSASSKIPPEGGNDDGDDGIDQDVGLSGGKRADQRPHRHGPSYKILKTKPALCM